MNLKLVIVATSLLLTLSTALYGDITGSSTGGPYNIPDNDFNGVDALVSINANEVITDIELIVTGLDHSFASDLTILLLSPDQTQFLSTISAPRLGLSGGDADFFGDYTFSDGGGDLWAAMSGLSSTDLIAEGDYFPSLNDGSAHPGFASEFGGLSTMGDWTINISDASTGETGLFNSVTLNFTSTAVPEPSSLILGFFATGLCMFRRRRASS